MRITREEARDMAEAHAEGMHGDPREGCPECEGRDLRDYPPAGSHPRGKLNIPADAECLVCGKQATHLLSLRMRREDTGADWAPNTTAFFCTAHANGGAKITVLYEPTGTKEVETGVVAVRHAAARTTPITRGRER
jgi:hypothetical protein